MVFRNSYFCRRYGWTDIAGYIISRLHPFRDIPLYLDYRLGLFSLAVILSFFLKRRPAHGRYWFTRILKERKNNENWRLITNAHFFQGLREGTFIFVISVFVFISTGSEFAIGTFGLINSGIAFIGYFLTSRLIKKKYRKKSILIGGLILYCAIFLIVFDLTYARLLLYAGIIAVAYPLLLVPYISMTYDVIGKGWKAAEMRIEYIVVREIFLNLGRIVSILAFIFAITFFNEEKSIPILLMILGSGHSIIYLFIRKVKIPMT